MNSYLEMPLLGFATQLLLNLGKVPVNCTCNSYTAMYHINVTHQVERMYRAGICNRESL